MQSHSETTNIALPMRKYIVANFHLATISDLSSVLLIVIEKQRMMGTCFRFWEKTRNSLLTHIYFVQQITSCHGRLKITLILSRTDLGSRHWLWRHRVSSLGGRIPVEVMTSHQWNCYRFAHSSKLIENVALRLQAKHVLTSVLCHYAGLFGVSLHPGGVKMEKWSFLQLGCTDFHGQS